MSKPNKEPNESMVPTKKKKAVDLAPIQDFKLTIKQFYDIAHGLECHYAIFYQIWELGDPIFVDRADLKTSALSFNKSGKAHEFLFNIRFWQSLNDYNRRFIICHECLHALLNHGYRIWQLINSDNRFDASVKIQLANKAMDVVINEMLVDKFGFSKKHITDWEEYCWLETIFKEEEGVLPNQNFEYYYNLLIKMCQEGKIKIIEQFVTVDDHSGMSQPPEDGEEAPDNKEFIKKLDRILSDEEKKGLEEKVKSDLNGQKAEPKDKNKDSKNKIPSRGGLQAGTGTGNWFTLKDLQIKVKHKWETIIKRWEKYMLEETFMTVEQWTRKARRIATLDSGELIIPSEIDLDITDLEKHRITVWFFLDTSGSCFHLAERFFRAARSLSPRYFEVRLFNFDTSIYPVNLKDGKAAGGGGTTFSNIPPYIESICKKENKQYPKAIWIISDGYGDDLGLDKKWAKRWTWFLTEQHSTNCITPGCKIYDLKDFE